MGPAENSHLMNVQGHHTPLITNLPDKSPLLCIPLATEQEGRSRGEAGQGGDTRGHEQEEFWIPKQLPLVQLSGHSQQPGK